MPCKFLNSELAIIGESSSNRDLQVASFSIALRLIQEKVQNNTVSLIADQSEYYTSYFSELQNTTHAPVSLSEQKGELKKTGE